MDNKQLHCQITENLDNRIKRQAVREKTTITDLVTYAIEAYLAKPRKVTKPHKGKKSNGRHA